MSDSLAPLAVASLLEAVVNPHSEPSLRREGAIARAQSIARDKNPFAENSIAAQCWLEGWDACELAIIKMKAKGS